MLLMLTFKVFLRCDQRGLAALYCSLRHIKLEVA